MEFRHLFIGLGRLGARTVEEARQHLVRMGIEPMPEITSIGFDLERSGDIPVPTLSLPLDELKEVLANIDYRSHDPSGWKESIPWFPDPERCQVNLDGLDSAGRSRPIGRLAFEIFRSIIEAELRRKIDRLAPQKKHQSVEISIVTSLMDGLGSGMVYDVAHLCRAFMPTASITLYLAIPERPKVHGGSLRPYQNTYAALRELRLFASLPRCFRPTWRTGSVFLAQHQLGVLDQAYCLDLPVDRLSTWQAKVDLLARALAHRCRPEVAHERRQLLAGAVEAAFLCNSGRQVEPALRRAFSASIPLTAFRRIQRVEHVISVRWSVPGEELREHSVDADDEEPLNEEELDSIDEAVEAPRNAAAAFMQSVNKYLQARDAVPRLRDVLVRWEAELEEAGRTADTSDLSRSLDASLRRLGYLLFKPNALKPSDHTVLITEDLKAEGVDRELSSRAQNFVDKDAKIWGTEKQLRRVFEAEVGKRRAILSKNLRGPDYERLRNLWQELDRFDGWLRPPGGLPANGADATALVQERNRALRLEILSQASQELHDYEITRNLLRLEAARRVLQKLKGLEIPHPVEPDTGITTGDPEEAGTDEPLQTPANPKLPEGEEALLQKLAEAVEYWRRPGETEPASFVERLKKRYQMEGRLLFFIPPAGFRGMLEDTFHAFLDASPFVTRVSPAGRHPQSPRALVVVSLPQAFFWYKDDDQLEEFILEVATGVLGHCEIHITRVPGLDDLWIYFEEIGRPVHQLAGITDFRAAYEDLLNCGAESLATLHIDRSLLKHLPPWPESKGPEPEPCPEVDPPEPGGSGTRPGVTSGAKQVSPDQRSGGGRSI